MLSEKDGLLTASGPHKIKIRVILEAQASSGVWITRDDRFKKTMPRGVRWNGEYEVMDRISGSVFNRNVAILCEYIALSDWLDQL